MKKVMDFLLYQIATGLGTGLSPVAPGTAGSALAVVLVWLFWPASLFYQGITVVLTTLIAVYAAGWLAEAEGLKDPSIVVSDEIAGQFTTFLLVPTALMGWQALIIGFLFFRAFDIWKPWPVHRLEDLPGGWGIVMDDVFAGVYAGVCTHVSLRILAQWM